MLKVMSFNTQHFLNYKTKKIDYNSTINLINKYKPDIIGLNEVYGKKYDKNIKTSQIEEVAKRKGYYYYFGKATKLFFKDYGNALLSKYPIIEAKTIKIPRIIFKKGFKYYEKRSIIKAKIQIKDKIITIYITHLGLNKDEQIKGLNTLNSLLKDDKFIIMGDFNISYGNKLLNIISDKTFDTANLFNNQLFSWPSDKPKYKFDYILTSKDIKTISADIPNDIVSDHRPYIAEIEI